MKKTRVEIYYWPNGCPYCNKALNVVEQEKAKYDFILEKIDVTHDLEKKKIMIERSGGRTSVPQIFINNYHVGGCDDLLEAKDSGNLAKLLDN